MQNNKYPFRNIKSKFKKVFAVGENQNIEHNFGIIYGTIFTKDNVFTLLQKSVIFQLYIQFVNPLLRNWMRALTSINNG